MYAVMYSTLRPRFTYGLFTFAAELRDLQREAITELIMLAPGEKRARLGSYGLPTVCEVFREAIIQEMTPSLEEWAASRRFVFEDDIDDPWFRPEVFRLERGGTLWPMQDCTFLLLPLHQNEVRMELVQKGTGMETRVTWSPNTVIHATDMGVRFVGPGTVKFIYIMLKIERNSQPETIDLTT